MTIIISQSGKNAKRLERRLVQQESYLQQYIYENPEALPLDDLKEDLRLLIVAREFPTPSGPVDLLGVDADADLYVIETKLYKNPDKRLVIAQVLDYGASLWAAYSEPAAFLSKLDEVITAAGGSGLGPLLTESYGLEGSALSEYCSALGETVSSGRFRFVVLMDRIDEPLKDLIAFVNANSRFDVLGVALDFYKHAELDIVIPHLYGAETKKHASAAAGGARRRWDDISFFADAELRLTSSDLGYVRHLYDWAARTADAVTWGTGAQRGSFNAKFHTVNARSVFSVYSDGDLSLNFKWLKNADESAKWAQHFGSELQKLPGFSIPADFTEKYVTMSVAQWGPQVDDFTTALEQLLPGS